MLPAKEGEYRCKHLLEDGRCKSPNVNTHDLNDVYSFFKKAVITSGPAKAELGKGGRVYCTANNSREQRSCFEASHSSGDR